MGFKMSLEQRSYSVLIVSATDALANSFKSIFEGAYYSPIHTVSSIPNAKHALLEREYDFVIINSPLPGDDGTRFAIDTCTKNSVVLLMVRNEIHPAIHAKVARYGVFTVSKPTPKPLLITAMEFMESARERLRAFEKKTASLDEKMAEIRTINKAKWTLINALQMSEPEAHHYIQKQAMDRGLSKLEVAEEIIEQYPS